MNLGARDMKPWESSPRTVREEIISIKSPGFCVLGGHMGLTLLWDTGVWGLVLDHVRVSQ